MTTTLNYVYVKDIRPGDFLPYLGDTVVSVETLPNGNVGLTTEHSGVWYLEAYEKFQNVVRPGEVHQPPAGPEPRYLDAQEGRL